MQLRPNSFQYPFPMAGKLRRTIGRFPLISFYLAVFMVAPNHPAEAAENYSFSSLSNGCRNSYTSAAFGSRYVVSRTSNISTITVQIGGGSVINFSTSRYYIRSDTSGNPGATIATFTPVTVSNGLARYTGTFSATSGTKFWITPGQSFTSFPGCYGQPLLNSDLTTDGSINVDSQTGLTSVFYSQSNDGGVTWGAGTASNFLFQLGIEAGGSDTSTIVISGISPNTSPLIYRSSYTLTATLSTPGKTTFYAQGKTIAGCKNVATSTSTSTCIWKPASHGSIAVYATLNPTNSALKPSTSAERIFGVAPRSNKR